MFKNSLDHLRLMFAFDEGDDSHSPVAFRANQRINFKNFLQTLCPALYSRCEVEVFAAEFWHYIFSESCRGRG